MKEFKMLFGVDQDEIQKHVIISPYLSLKELSRPKRGYLYQTTQEKEFSFIRTGIGAPLVGDAVLHLKDTPCQNIFFLGSCAMLDKSSIGSILLGARAYSSESFYETISLEREKKLDPEKFFTPDPALAGLARTLCPDLKKTVVFSTGSIKMERSLAGFLSQNGFTSVEMELASFYYAASYIHKRAVGLLFATDDLNKNLFYLPKNPDLRKKITDAQDTLLKTISQCIAKLNASI